ncbi:hypothetical protein GBAR_LOCUS3962 [Geodia barretti]|uniref:Uncharacterized protein n=1 Tax=Geodia barretti TaxID=519541 RepID=A0AA35R5F6_GEOBA|nr:hypothetical protein GBAR_LOCUS3962 [Geodia barretti]
MNAYGVLVMFSLGMIVLPVGGFFLSKAILFEVDTLIIQRERIGEADGWLVFESVSSPNTG